MLRVICKRLSRPHEVKRIAGNLPHFDVCIIGGGPAGIAAALRAVDYNKRVCLIEANRIGGCDLWNGTLQSKTLWEMAKYVSRLSSPAARRVFAADDFLSELSTKVSDARVQETLRDVSTVRERHMLDALSTAGVTLLNGSAMFSSPRELDVHSSGSVEYRVVTADYFVIATGSKPREHPHFACDRRMIVTTDDIMTLPIPKSLVIIGAGLVGCEFASIYANLGRTRVSVIDKAPRILMNEDEDVASFVQSQLLRRGVTVHHTSNLFDLEPRADGCAFAVRAGPGTGPGQRNDMVESFTAERALVALGRSPNIARLGLELAACKVLDGRLALDKFGRCEPHHHIYAVGDVSGDRALLNYAEAQAITAIDHMYSDKRVRPVRTMRMSNLSTILFLEEEFACVGLNEQECRKMGLSHVVARCGYEYQSRAIAMGETKGFCKVITTNDREKRLLGVQAVGAHAGSIVEVASSAVRRDDSAYELMELNAAYPSVVQSFVECVRVLLGRSAVKPNTTPAVTLNVWRPPGLERGRAYESLQNKKGS